jgi:hypothetical protein
MTYRTEPGWKTGRTKGARDLQNGGAERLELEGKDLLRSLQSCRGFTVDFGDGRVGRVIEVRLGLLSGEPEHCSSRRGSSVGEESRSRSSTWPLSGRNGDTSSFGTQESWASQGRVASFLPLLGEAGAR